MTEIEIGQVPVFFGKEDFDKQQMACELMDLREQVENLKKQNEDLKTERAYWFDLATKEEVMRSKVKRELVDKVIYELQSF